MAAAVDCAEALKPCSSVCLSVWSSHRGATGCCGTTGCDASFLRGFLGLLADFSTLDGDDDDASVLLEASAWDWSFFFLPILCVQYSCSCRCGNQLLGLPTVIALGKAILQPPALGRV